MCKFALHAFLLGPGVVWPEYNEWASTSTNDPAKNSKKGPIPIPPIGKQLSASARFFFAARGLHGI